MKKQISLIMLGLLLISVFAFLPNFAHGYTPADYKTSIIKAADRLVALQSPTDFGWDWVLDGLTSHTANPSATNLYGITALGLLDAYELTGNASYLTVAKKTADFMKYGDPSAGDFYNGPNATYNWGYSSDYSFLMKFSAVSGDVSYKTYALAAWAWQKTGTLHVQTYYGDGNQSAIWDDDANHWIGTNKYGAAAWDTSGWGLATLEMGDTAWATNMAVVIHANMANILSADVASDYKDIGMGWTLKFLVTLDPVTYASDITSLKTALKADQLSDGSWDYGPPPPGDEQTTAYVVMGLWTAGEYTTAQKGVDWLVTTQLTNGGWNSTEATPHEYSEPDSEGLQALFTTLVHDVAVTNVAANRTWVYQGWSANINVTVSNNGDFAETVNVTLYYNITASGIIGIQNVALSVGESKTLLFVWNTTGVPYCHNYTLTATATIPADFNPLDNILDNVYVKVGILGDLNGDGKIDGKDIAMVALSFGTVPGDPRWNPDADINRDNKIDGKDITLIAKNFGLSCNP